MKTALQQGFDLEAEISVSQLRQEDLLDGRLREHHCLRLRRKNDVIGVLIDSKTWNALADRVQKLEAELAQREDDAVRALIADRAPRANWVQATDETIAAIDREYRKLGGE